MNKKSATKEIVQPNCKLDVRGDLLRSVPFKADLLRSVPFKAGPNSGIMDFQSRVFRDGIFLNPGIAGFFGVGTFPVSNTAWKLNKNICVGPVGHT